MVFIRDDKEYDLSSPDIDKVIEPYGLKYDHGLFYGLPENYLKNSGISFKYKDTTLSLDELRNTYDIFNNRLEPIPNIHSLDVLHRPKLNYSLGDSNIKNIIETFNLFQDLYSTITSAQYALKLSHKKIHDNNSMPWSNEEAGQFWIRINYLKNAIIWYDCSFDLCLQILWIGEKQYTKQDIGEKHKKRRYTEEEILANKIFAEIICFCKPCYFNQYEFVKKFKNNKLNTLRTWANHLKHRGNLRFAQTHTQSNLAFSTATFERESGNRIKLNNGEKIDTYAKLLDVDQVIETTAIFHNDIISLIAEVYQSIKIYFKNNYSLEI